MKCPICNIDDKKILLREPLPPGQGYLLRKIFEHLLQEHGLNYVQTCETYFEEVPLCGCGCGQKTSLEVTSRISFKKFIRFHSTWNKGLTKETNDSLKKLSQSRKGEGNNRFGKPAWNKGLTKETNDSLKKLSQSRKGIVFLEETRKKMSYSASNRKREGRCGHVHSSTTIDLLRKITAKNISLGKCGAKKTTQEFIVEEELKQRRIEFISQKWIEFFCFDFFLPKYNCVIEIDGDWLHCHNCLPTTPPQKRVVKQDQVKNLYCKKKGIKILRITNSQVEEGDFEWMLQFQK